ncbi:hypothetical protein BPP43_03945 [Brachyspira pilosicoli P43/6/78]|uniref:TPR domain-containing protein n=1 Tax=Brachyspira pilosicoli P43/6/78 TaxID=1042417 RepID=A0A3B6VUE9_BRAPL|nr:hypothetical protein [Brachyspira pilosicoli]AGA66079.1 hypothetical protein BPP43_03945 [Brachyspira pilosicoli P43/6/78]
MINLTLFLIDYQQGSDLLKEGKYSSAITRFESLIEMLDYNKDTISDYKELKECIKNNIEGCKLLMKGF